jgi:hypothetical protein
MVWFSGDALVTGSAGPLWVDFLDLGFGVAMVMVALWALASMLRPALVLTPDAARIPRGPFRTLCIPVGEISGIGLVFERSSLTTGRRPEPGWHMRVWHGDGDGEPVSITYVPALFSIRNDARVRQKYLVPAPTLAADNPRRRFSVTTFDAAAETYPVMLAATDAGRVARDVYQRVLACQGPTGPLATIGQQRHIRAASLGAASSVLAFWSPDGVIGRPAKRSARPPYRTAQS